MTWFFRLLVSTVVVTLAGAGAGLAQTQRQINTLGSPMKSEPMKSESMSMSPEAAAAWQQQCEGRADEKKFKGSKRKSIVAKCVKLKDFPPELR